MCEIEFEQKYVLDPRTPRVDDLVNLLSTMPEVEKTSIRQFYSDDGQRYRHVICQTHETARVERKKKVNLGTTYRVSIEEEPAEISIARFERKWQHATRRLSKTRFEAAIRPGHDVMVDFFLRPGNRGVYAIVAEVETVLSATTISLCLDLELPIYLKPFLLKRIDANTPLAKVFRSANMVETPDSIAAIEKVLKKFYDDAQSLRCIGGVP